MTKTILYTLFPAFVLFTACNTDNKPKPAPKATPTNAPEAIISTELDKDIYSILQDKNGNYWFGTNGAGVYRYGTGGQGKSLTHFTEQDGLSGNQVQTIQEDKTGNLWFGTGGFGVSRFDASQTFTTLTKASVPVSKQWTTAPDDLFFNAGGGVYRYGTALDYLPLPNAPQRPANQLGPYGVYCTLTDKKGNLWLGTQSMGVCRYDARQHGAKAFTWFTEKGLAGPAVLALFEDKNGNLWFGNNGNGLFRCDPVSGELTNFTAEKGLSNAEFRKSGKQGPGTLARIYTINEDNSGDLWVGTVDAGVWRYDGVNITNYTTKDGLTTNEVNTIYKDQKGALWFGTTAGVCTFNGSSFTKWPRN